MNCTSCINRLKAANRQMIGCAYWTSIVHGDIRILKSALMHISQLKNCHFDLDNPAINHEIIAYLIDILINEYAPKPLYEGWATPSMLSRKDENDRGMTKGCVVLNPGTCCTFYQHHLYEPAGA